ncbi:la-related protein 1A-like [Salvia miltiorrhiza]|uniref:la-related protein 1A-like n=1 Tax=Salvia miltiorrhiza TaxID=226208 RepID=UPI0025AD00FA|nr:la-related protein 1A-like [Salvia miltiorrhiza]
MPTHQSTASRSNPNDRRRLPPPPPPPSPPVCFPYSMLPYNHPYASAPPMGFMLPPPSFVPPPPPLTKPPWNNSCIYTQTLHPPYWFPHPTPTPTPPLPLPYCINYTTPPLHPPSNSLPPPSLSPISQEEDLRHKILKQIEYYFCDDNLATDVHLKDQMDIDNGWVPIELIARFNRIKEMTDDIKLILDSLKDSDIVEVEGDKLRRRTTWKKWIAYRQAASRN